MNTKGFTLIEFIVIMSIFAIMASVALFNFQGFRSNVAVNNLAQDIGLLARQAQTFGWATLSDDVGGQVVSLINDNPLRFAHGIFLDYNNGSFENTLTLYRKQTSVAGDEFFSSNDTVIDIITIQGLYIVNALASAQTKDDLLIINNQIPSSINFITDDVSIAFSRPLPEALFFQGSVPLNANYIGLYIGQAGQATNAEKVIIISRSGEIWVE